MLAWHASCHRSGDDKKAAARSPQRGRRLTASRRAWRTKLGATCA